MYNIWLSSSLASLTYCVIFVLFFGKSGILNEIDFKNLRFLVKSLGKVAIPALYLLNVLEKLSPADMNAKRNSA
jgi:uncharacterized membrane protein